MKETMEKTVELQWVISNRLYQREISERELEKLFQEYMDETNSKQMEIILKSKKIYINFDRNEKKHDFLIWIGDYQQKERKVSLEKGKLTYLKICEYCK